MKNWKSAANIFSFSILMIFFILCEFRQAKSDEIFVKEIDPIVGPGSYDRLHRGHKGLVATEDGRLLVMYNGRSGLHIRMSLDYGVTWKGLHGDNKADYIESGNGNNTQNHHAFGGDLEGNGYAFFVHTCNGGGKPVNLYFVKLTRNSDSWTIGPANVVATDPHKCTTGMSVFSGKDGKLWTAWSHTDANANLYVSVRYSDDDGVTWKIAGGKKAVSDIQYGHGYDMGDWDQPFLTFYKNSVACIWRKYNDINWAYFDNASWTEPSLVYDPADYYSTISGVTAENNNIFVASRRHSNLHVSRWDGKNWVTELIDQGGSVAGPRLAACGNAVFCFYAKDNRMLYRKYLINEKVWTNIETIATDDNSIEEIATPSISPSNYAAAVWSDGENLKFVRITFENTSVDQSESKDMQNKNCSISLSNNYPNPFNANTTIPYKVEKNGKNIILSIYNINGELVKTLENRYKEPGQYSVEWDGKDFFGNNVCTGVYICSLIVDHQIVNKKILLLR